jgi:cytochrome c biogenesis protein CcmG/thiol:disulfide interchange protein DsbE
MSGVKTERILVIAIGLCLAVLAWSVYGTFHERIIAAGDTAPDFSITTDAGRTITRANFGGKLLVLNFWATWCPPCLEEMPSLNQFQKQFADQGVVVLAVSVDQNSQAYSQYLARLKPAFQTARDPEGGISADYGTSKYPETYIIRPDGKVVEKIISNRDWMDPSMVNEIKSLLAS